jgi:hypothetical protein
MTTGDVSFSFSDAAEHPGRRIRKAIAGVRIEANLFMAAV